jgi:hypothetical protein
MAANIEVPIYLPQRTQRNAEEIFFTIQLSNHVREQN